MAARSEQGIDSLDKLLSLRVVLESQTLNIVRQPDKWGLEEATALLPLLNKVGRAQAQFRIRRAQAFIALMHTGRDVRRLAHLVTASEIAIVDLVNQYSKPVRINRSQRVPFDCVPSALDDLRRRESSRVRNETTICLQVCCQQERISSCRRAYTDINDRILIVHRTQNIETAQLPFPTFACEYRRGPDDSVDRRRISIDELECGL